MLIQTDQGVLNFPRDYPPDNTGMIGPFPGGTPPNSMRYPVRLSGLPFLPANPDYDAESGEAYEYAGGLSGFNHDGPGSSDETDYYGGLAGISDALAWARVNNAGGGGFPDTGEVRANGADVFTPGLYRMGGMGDAAWAQTDTPGSGGWIDPATITAANSEAVFIANLWRGLNNQPQLNVATSSPAVNIGITPQVQNMLLLGGAGILALVLLNGRGKKRRR